MDPLYEEKNGKIKRYPDGTLMTEWNRINKELDRAQKHRIQVIFLVGHGRDIRSLSAVRKLAELHWKNGDLEQWVIER